MVRLWIWRIALLLGAALLVAAFFVPWLTYLVYPTPDYHVSLLEAWSPANILVGAFTHPSSGVYQYSPVTSPIYSTFSLMYMAGALVVVALIIPVWRGPQRRDALSPVPWSLLAGAITCGVIALLMWPSFQVLFGLMSATLAAGLPLALAGATLAAAGVIGLATGPAPRSHEAPSGATAVR